jgi:hypothetical protein
MPETTSDAGKPDLPIAGDIEELARRLRAAEHLEPKARAEVAELLRNLAAELDRSEPSADEQHLAESTAQLVRAVEDQHDSSLIEAARERVEEAVARAEAIAPVSTDLVLQLIDVLASLGI